MSNIIKKYFGIILPFFANIFLYLLAAENELLINEYLSLAIAVYYSVCVFAAAVVYDVLVKRERKWVFYIQILLTELTMLFVIVSTFEQAANFLANTFDYPCEGRFLGGLSFLKLVIYPGFAAFGFFLVIITIPIVRFIKYCMNEREEIDKYKEEAEKNGNNKG